MLTLLAIMVAAFLLNIAVSLLFEFVVIPIVAAIGAVIIGGTHTEEDATHGHD